VSETIKHILQIYKLLVSIVNDENLSRDTTKESIDEKMSVDTIEGAKNLLGSFNLVFG